MKGNLAREHCADVQFLSDSMRIHFLPLVVIDRGARDHFYVGKARDAIDQAVGKPISQIFDITAAASEGQDGNGSYWRAGGQEPIQRSSDKQYQRQRDGNPYQSVPAN